MHGLRPICLSLVGSGLDPTNDLLAFERHIRAAIGRDYADVPPTRGVFRGEAGSELAGLVTVALADSPTRSDRVMPMVTGCAGRCRTGLCRSTTGAATTVTRCVGCDRCVRCEAGLREGLSNFFRRSRCASCRCQFAELDAAERDAF